MWGNEINLVPLGQYLNDSKIIQWGHLNARNIVTKINTTYNYIVSMATHNAILKMGAVPTKNHISAATHARIINFVSNETVHIFLSFVDLICKLFNFYIYEYK